MQFNNKQNQNASSKFNELQTASKTNTFFSLNVFNAYFKIANPK